MSLMRGKIFFFSGPSGVGKGTLIRMLQEKHPDWVFPPSCTTRDPRPGEVDGETYFFITQEEFSQRIKKGEFLEWAEVHGGNRYGTLLHKLVDPISEGKIVIREFDVQGFLQARERLPREDFVSFFITPEHGEQELIERILKRAPMPQEEIDCRMDSLQKELAESGKYDHILISRENQLDRLLADAESLIEKAL
jgi:guanylate kinase